MAAQRRPTVVEKAATLRLPHLPPGPCFRNTSGQEEWGIECLIDAQQTIIALNNRQNSNSTTGTTIPAGGYVLSGNGKAADWLLATATAGAKVELVYLAPTGGAM